MSKTAEEIAADLAKPSDVVVICSDDCMNKTEAQHERFAAAFKAMTGCNVMILPADATVRMLRLGTGTVDEAKPLNLVALTEEQVRRIEEALRPTGHAATCQRPFGGALWECTADCNASSEASK